MRSGYDQQAHQLATCNGKGMRQTGAQQRQGRQIVCRSPQVARRLQVEERLEAGLVLTGSEVKSLRQRRANLEGAFVWVDGGEAWLVDAYIAPYEHAGYARHEPRRRRKLLLHRREIERLRGQLAQRGRTALPSQIYFKDGWAKVEILVGRGRKSHDRRLQKERDEARRMAREAVMRHRGGSR